MFCMLGLPSLKDENNIGSAVMQVAACASSRYEFEVFSGEVMRVDSEALVQEQSLLLAAARTANLWRKSPLASVHQMVVRAPDGQARTFRFGTESADVPAQVYVPPAHFMGCRHCSCGQRMQLCKFCYLIIHFLRGPMLIHDGGITASSHQQTGLSQGHILRISHLVADAYKGDCRRGSGSA